MILTGPPKDCYSGFKVQSKRNICAALGKKFDDCYQPKTSILPDTQ